jgi:hypothetical protein
MHDRRRHVTVRRLSQFGGPSCSRPGHRGQPRPSGQIGHDAGGVLEQDLTAAGTGDDVVAEAQAGLVDSGDLGGDVADDEVDAFQPSGPGLAPSCIGRPAELAGPLSSSRRLPRVTSANAGAALPRSVKPRCVV